MKNTGKNNPARVHVGTRGRELFSEKGYQRTVSFTDTAGAPEAGCTTSM